jgi:twitching motility protein PilT
MANYKLMDVIKHGVEKGSSDVHIGIGIHPKIRIDSQLIDTHFDVVDEKMLEDFLIEITPAKKIEIFKKELELDFSFQDANLGAFRVNVFMQRNAIGFAIRILPTRIRTFDEIGISPDLMTTMASSPTGLVLVTGATGSGKTTTLAAMIDHINNNRKCHIITVEDPIEFIYQNRKSKIEQREVGRDTYSFGRALKYVLRQDPDVVLIGEMRDLETIETALNVAETGHLVFATLHTSDAVQTVNRVIDVFPEHQQRQVRVQLSFVLNAVLAQRLVPHASGQGRVLSAEIMIANNAVRAMIRDEKVHQLYSMIQTGAKEGMKTMNQSLADLVHADKIKLEDAMNYSSDVNELLEHIS